MEQKLHELLEEDEQLLWCGRPERFETLDKSNKQSILVGLVVKVLVVAGILAMYIRAALAAAGVKWGIIAAILAIGAYAVLNPFLTARRLRSKTFYGLSDRRVLRTGANDESVPYERIKSAALRMDADGHTTLLCGPRTKDLKPHQWRGEADASFINGPDDPEALRVILYNLPMTKELKAILKEKIGVQ
mgnify:CR=1 FL=1